MEKRWRIFCWGRFKSFQIATVKGWPQQNRTGKFVEAVEVIECNWSEWKVPRWGTRSSNCEVRSFRKAISDSGDLSWQSPGSLKKFHWIISWKSNDSDYDWNNHGVISSHFGLQSVLVFWPGLCSPLTPNIIHIVDHQSQPLAFAAPSESKVLRVSLWHRTLVCVFAEPPSRQKRNITGLVGSCVLWLGFSWW